MRRAASSIPGEISAPPPKDRRTPCSLRWPTTIAHFDRVLNWTQANLAGGDLQTHLPAWLWGKNKDGEWKTLDPNSASDADIWMAYTLVEAGRLWKIPVYANLGRQMMAQIAKTEVADLPGFGLMLLPGPTGFQHDRRPGR
jgi:endo-1,4-beta-D-glucanase Y